MDLDGEAAAAIMAKAWGQLRLAVRAPSRFAAWDAILITAASPSQAQMYTCQLAAARYAGHISPRTVALAVPDRQGQRIGSGAATLGAIQALAEHLGRTPTPSPSPPLLTMRVLLIHAGGDSKRLPWANPMGKPFLPFPLLAGLDPDGPPLTLFDHILAVAALALTALPATGGALFIMTGDVLPCFDASALRVAPDAATVVTTPAPLDVASRHGVIVPAEEGGGSSAAAGQPGRRGARPAVGGPAASNGENEPSGAQPSSGGAGGQAVERAGAGAGAEGGAVAEGGAGAAAEAAAPAAAAGGVAVVRDLLQKPSPAEMVAGGAVRGKGTALLDTGMYAVCGEAWGDMIEMAKDAGGDIEKLIMEREDMSLYEEMASAWVPARRPWLVTRPMGRRLAVALGRRQLHHCCCGGEGRMGKRGERGEEERGEFKEEEEDAFSFLHFGTSGEFLDHLRPSYGGRLPRCHLSAVPPMTECHVAPDATIICSDLTPGCSVGGGSLVCDSCLGAATRVGPRCIVVGVDTGSAADSAARDAAASAATAAADEVAAPQGSDGGRGGSSAACADSGRATDSVSPAPSEALAAPLAESRAHPAANHAVLAGGTAPPHLAGAILHQEGAPAHSPLLEEGPPHFAVPPSSSVWEVPLLSGRWVLLCCGVDDNPKQAAAQGGTFCGRPWAQWMRERGVRQEDLWPDTPAGALHRCSLWSARLFPLVPRAASLRLCQWLLAPPAAGNPPSPPPNASGGQQHGNQSLLLTWREAERVSLSALHSRVDFPALLAAALRLRSSLVARIAAVDIRSLSLARNFAALARHLLLPDVLRRSGHAGAQPPAPLVPPPEPTPSRLSDSPAEAGSRVRDTAAQPAPTAAEPEQRQSEPSAPATQQAADFGREQCRQLLLLLERTAGEQPLQGHAGAGGPPETSGSLSAEEAAATPAPSQGGEGIAPEVGPELGAGVLVPRSRLQQVRVDLLRAAGLMAGEEEEEEGEGEAWEGEGRGQESRARLAREEAVEEAELVWRLVEAETAAAVGEAETQQGEGPPVSAPSLTPAAAPGPPPPLPPVGSCVRVRLPVRLDFAGGWSDTPPWSLERCGRVLNVAVELGGQRPVAAEVAVVARRGILLSDDQGASLLLTHPSDIPRQLSPSLPFCIVQAALQVTGMAALWAASLSSSSASPANTGAAVTSSPVGATAGGGSPAWGLDIATSAAVPRGSGLGTSSIVAAAVVRALLLLLQGRVQGTEGRVQGEDGQACGEQGLAGGGTVSNEAVSRLVLLLEQRMATGGGWQDQVGGLFPGIKCTSSLPTRPLQLQVDALPLLPAVRSELQARMVVAFVGQVRLARNVLRNVVSRYLQRDSRLLSAIQRLTVLADVGRRAICTVDLDLLGAVMAETWRIHQELDPHCSNAEVDALFARVNHLSCGHKLAGAGGGGFAMILAKSSEAADEIKDILRGLGEPIQVADWAVCIEEDKLY